METPKKQPLNGRGDYLPISPMKSRDISSDVLKNAALPDAKIKIPSGSASGSWWGSGADAEPSWDMPAPPKKKKNGNIWSVIIDIVGGLANASSSILSASKAPRGQSREADHTQLFSYLQQFGRNSQPAPKTAGIIDPGAIEFILLLGAGGFFLSEALKHYQSEKKKQVMRTATLNGQKKDY